MSTSELDPLADAERVIRDAHTSTHKQLRVVHRKYRLSFLFLLTVSVAALFHGLDELLNEFSFFTDYPLVLVVLGILGLFITGSLYKGLGSDKFE